MANTRSLNSDDSVWVTTFYNENNTRCYTITINVNGIQVTSTITDTQLMGMLVLNGGKATEDNGVRPRFHRGK